ncbi:hypothetical protein EYF80_047650 [Liparis tanakae]|uniref:Secreted protein n=1 Tax=Liparis tanakae TaxID=230148 RepID=A0A4Z2FM26_9TELE|nr:hypothetical protein EYF80_047650 [Liparis tanakae]
MEPTPALWALFLWTWRPVANRMPSFTVTERCENEAIRSSFQPGSLASIQPPKHSIGPKFMLGVDGNDIEGEPREDVMTG